MAAERSFDSFDALQMISGVRYSLYFHDTISLKVIFVSQRLSQYSVVSSQNGLTNFITSLEI